MRFLPRLLVLCAAVVVACADNSFTGPTTPAAPVLGMDIHAAPPPVLAWLKANRVPWVRVTYYYQAPDDTTGLVAELQALHDNGQQVDLVVHSTPPDDTLGAGIPHAVANLLRSRPGVINAVELYNEENVGASYWRPVLPGATDFARGQAYAPRYAAMRDTVRALYPLLRVPVVSGGTAGDPGPFLAGVKSRGATPDIVGIHAYGYPPYSQLSEFTTSARAVYPGIRVWATEVGSEGGRTDPATLNLDIVGSRTWLAAHPDVRAFWYCAWGDPVDGVLLYDTFQPRAGTLHLFGPF